MKITFVAILAGVLAVVFVDAASAQTGQLHGTIVDQESGELLTGVNVLLVGTSLGASSDLEGKFIVRSIPPGTYDVRISLVGYTAKVVTGLDIKPDVPVKLDIGISSEAYTTD